MQVSRAAAHGSRPDVTRLLLNNKPARRVEHFSLPVDPAEVATDPATSVK
jgi:nitrilase